MFTGGKLDLRGPFLLNRVEYAPHIPPDAGQHFADKNNTNSYIIHK